MISFKLTIKNAAAGRSILTLEPWGDRYEMPPNSAIDLVCTGPDGGRLEIEHSEESVVVFGWPGSVIDLEEPQPPPPDPSARR